MRKKKPVIIEVNSGVVTNVWNCKNWEVLDWDNLLGDGADTSQEWSKLPERVQKIVQHEYPVDFARIMDRIKEGI
jgi:hypothetical protein